MDILVTCRKKLQETIHKAARWQSLIVPSEARLNPDERAGWGDQNFVAGHWLCHLNSRLLHKKAGFVEQVGIFF